MKESYCIYAHTFPNGKRYIGQCKEPAVNRWRNGWGYIHQPLIHNAIQKYGWENAKHEVICSGLTQKAAYEKETALIKKLNTNAVNGGNGYNMSDGGESGSKGYKHTDECKKRLSELNSGENNGFYGKAHTDDTKAKISAVHKGKRTSEESRRKMSQSKTGEKHPLYGMPRSEETKQKLSKANTGENSPNFGLKGRDCPRSKSYLCKETGATYISLSEIKDSLNLTDVSHISGACLGKRKTAYGYHWEHINKNLTEKR